MEYYVWNQGTESEHQYLTLALRTILLHDCEAVLLKVVCDLDYQVKKQKSNMFNVQLAAIPV